MKPIMQNGLAGMVASQPILNPALLGINLNYGKITALQKPATGTAPELNHSLKVVLIVDDDTDDQDFFIEAVSELDNGIKCVTAKNGLEALSMLQEKNEVPDYIFLDINMPCMNGKECLGEIRKIERLNRTPVVMLTTSQQPKDIDETRSLGATFFLSKPNSYNELKSSLSHLLFNGG